MSIDQANEKIAKLEKENKRLLAENEYLSKKLEKRPRKNKPTIKIIEKNDDYMKVRIDQSEAKELAPNEMILPWWGIGRTVVKLIWFDVNEEMVYDEEYKMEFPKSFYRKLEDWREEKRQREEEQRNRPRVYVTAQPNTSKYVEQQRTLRRNRIERILPDIREKHIKIKEQIIYELKEEMKVSIQEHFQRYFSNDQGFTKIVFENITEEEVLQAINDVPLFTEDVEWFYAIQNRNKILLQIKDNRKLNNGDITAECLEYCLKVEHGDIEQYCIINNYRKKMEQRGIEEAQLPAIYQMNKYRGCK